MKKTLLLTLAVIAGLVLAGCGKETVVVEEPISTAEQLFSQVTWVVDTGIVDTGYVEPVKEYFNQIVYFEEQPTKLPGNYQDNGKVLRDWASKNIQKILLPETLENGKIAFTFKKISKYDNIPGNFQLSIDWKNLCNGRLSSDAATIDYETNEYIYDITYVSTQDKPLGIDLSKYFGKELSIKAWVGENWNRLESVRIFEAH